MWRQLRAVFSLQLILRRNLCEELVDSERPTIGGPMAGPVRCLERGKNDFFSPRCISIHGVNTVDWYFAGKEVSDKWQDCTSVCWYCWAVV